MKTKINTGKFATIKIYKDQETVLSLPENLDNNFLNRIQTFASQIDSFCQDGSIYKTRTRSGTIFYNKDNNFLFTLLRATSKNHHLCFGLQETDKEPILMKLLPRKIDFKK